MVILWRLRLGAWSLGLVACALGQDPLDAGCLQLDLGTESRPGLSYQVELQQERGPLGHATVGYF